MKENSACNLMYDASDTRKSCYYSEGLSLFYTLYLVKGGEIPLM